MNKNLEWHKSFIRIAKEISIHSTCVRKQVGAILVKDRRIISIGYNGVISNSKHCNEIFKNKDITDKKFLEEHAKFSDQHEIHAECNCLMYAAKNGLKTDNCCLYITLSPCINCAKLIIASGIKEVYYMEKYDRDKSGIKFLLKNKIKVKQVNI